jgi:periplasmic divalent cation tolerance protein
MSRSESLGLSRTDIVSCRTSAAIGELPQFGLSSRHECKSRWRMTHNLVVLVTCGSAAEARKIGKRLVEKKLAACASVLEAPVRSIYRWKGGVESGREFLIIVKTSRKRFASVEREVRRLHSYDVPEIIALPVERGSQNYLKWISESL